ncbi:hypothetical protein QTP88_005510 [Uroleucon formosanum]
MAPTPILAILCNTQVIGLCLWTSLETEKEHTHTYIVGNKKNRFLDIGIDILDYVHWITCARSYVKVNLCCPTVQWNVQKDLERDVKTVLLQKVSFFVL